MLDGIRQIISYTGDVYSTTCSAENEYMGPHTCRDLFMLPISMVNALIFRLRIQFFCATEDSSYVAGGKVYAITVTGG